MFGMLKSYLKEELKYNGIGLVIYGIIGVWIVTFMIVASIVFLSIVLWPWFAIVSVLFTLAIVGSVWYLYRLEKELEEK